MCCGSEGRRCQFCTITLCYWFGIHLPPPPPFFFNLLQPQNISGRFCNAHWRVFWGSTKYSDSKPVTGFIWHQFTQMDKNQAGPGGPCQASRHSDDLTASSGAAHPCSSRTTIAPGHSSGIPKVQARRSFPIPGSPQLWFPVKYLESSPSGHNVPVRGPSYEKRHCPQHCWRTSLPSLENGKS